MLKSSLSTGPGLSDTQLHKLCKALWSWDTCNECSKLQSCPNHSSHSLLRFTTFLRHYNDTILFARLDIGTHYAQNPLEYEVILSIIVFVKRSPRCTRADIRQHLRDGPWTGLQVADVDGDVVINTAVKIMIMINCSSETVSLHLLEQGLKQLSWHEDVGLSDFIEEVFPCSDDSAVHDIRDAYCGLSSGRMTARKLIKHAKISLRPTSDIRAHLRYDRSTNTLDIFHHTTFLKEQLRATNGLVLDTAQSLERGALPRQLLLETLDSIQKILFPLDDTKSYSLLRTFISRYSLDSDCLRFDSTGIRQEYEELPSYKYTAPRLMELYEIASNPRPQKRYEKWLERRSGARYVMMATVAGIAFAIFLGMASLAVSIFQTYITYQAWKQPNQQR